MAYIQFLGAAGTVTGSKHLVSLGGDNQPSPFQVLVDCGLFQGQKEWRERNWNDLPVDAHSINAVILTHAHLDHCGWLPRLVKQGFNGPIYATAATIDLCGVVLPDSGHLQEEDADFHNQHKSSRHEPALPLYTAQEAQDCLRLFQPVAFGESRTLNPSFGFRFVHSAHILGAGMAEITLAQDGAARRLLFTGDLGRVQDTTLAPGKVIHHTPQEGESADVLVLESTYGNRVHPTNDPRPEIASLISATVRRGGSVVVPAFSIERTQKFLFILKELMESGQVPRIPVFADSPMAIKAVQIFLKHEEEFSEETKGLIARYGSPLKWDGFSFAAGQDDSKKINDVKAPCVIVSASGMCEGGRILHHLMQRLADPRNLILFIGFQAPGTRGAQIKSGQPQVKIFNQMIPVRAQVAAEEQFSDHADTAEMLKWLHTFAQAPKSTWLVHGEPAAAQALRDSIQAAMHWEVNVAQYMQKVPLQ